MMPACTGPDRDLMQALAFDRQEGIGLRPCAPAPRLPSGWRTPQTPMIEPGPRIGRAARLQARRDRGSRVPAGSPADACAPTEGKSPSGQARLTTAISPARSSSSAMWTVGRVAPQAEQRRARPPASIDRRAASRRRRRRRAARAGARSAVATCGMRSIRAMALIPTAWRRSGTRRPAPAADRCRP